MTEKIQKEKLLIINKELKKTNPVYITVNRYISKIRLSILAEKLIRAIASNIAVGNCTNLEDISLYTNIETSINTKTFCEIFNYKNDNNFTKIADAREELQRTGFTLPGKCRPTDSLIAKSYVKNGNMYFQISPLVLPYYIGKGMDYQLVNITNFKSINTFRFYEYLLSKLQNENETIFVLTFEEVKELLNLSDKYSQYINFKTKVLKPILADINGTDIKQENFCNIRLTIETVKNGRRMSGIKFTVTRKEPKVAPAISLNVIKEKLTKEGKEAYNFFQYTSNNGLFEIDDCVAEYGEERLIQIYEYVKYQYDNKKIRTSLKAYASNALRKGWCDPEVTKKKITVLKSDNPQLPDTPKEEPKHQETFDEKIYKKIISMTPKQQQALFEKTLKDYPDKSVFSYTALSSKPYEEIMNSAVLIKFYIRILKEQKYIDILMDEF